jgi:acid phosphatase family membrane protein YuiD
MSSMIYILVPLVAWAIAQGAKHLFVRYNRRRKIIDQPDSSHVLMPFAPSGGMPSAHSATVTALATIIGLKVGIDSPVFAIALLMAAVVMYDAVMVRFSSGEQGETILSILNHLKTSIERPKIAKGHTVPEVVAGVVIGLIVATMTFWMMK